MWAIIYQLFENTNGLKPTKQWVKTYQANEALDKLAKQPRQNFYEDKFFFNLKAHYFHAIGDNREELVNLNKLIPEGKDYLSKDSYVYSITRAFQLALLNNELASTLYFYDKLKQFDASNERLTALTPYIEKINTLITSSEHIFVTAQINEREHWNHYLARKSFTFANIEGKLSSVDIRCDNHFSTYALDSEKELKSITVKFDDGKKEKIQTDVILGFFGLIMKLGPIAEWGLNMDKKTIEVNPENFETNKKGIFAAGDICSYPGKLRLILSGFHEVALASVECFKRARPNEKYRFEFTTSSKTIQDRLGKK